MRLADAFPSIDWPKPLRGLWIEWRKDRDCLNIVALLRARFNAAQPLGDNTEAFGQAAIKDIFALKKSFTDHVSVFDALQFDIASGMMGLGATSKQIPVLWTWTIRSIFDGEFDHTVNFDSAERLRHLKFNDRLIVRSMFNDSFLDWLPLFFYLARRTGDFAELGDALFDMALETGFDAIPSARAAEVLVFALDWDVVQPHLQGGEAVRKLYDIYKSDVFPPSVRARIGIMFATRVGLKHGFNIQEEAHQILRRYSDFLTAHERLQVVCASLTPDFADLANKKAQILAAIEEYNGWLRKGGPSDLRRLYDKGPIFETLLPVLAAAFERGERQIAIELISAWKEIPAALSIGDNALIILPTRRNEVGISTREAFYQGESASNAAQYRELVKVTNAALGLTINIPEDAEFERTAPDRVGVPRIEHGGKLLSALENFYFQPSLQRIYEETSSDSVAIIPWIPHPINPLIQRQSGRSIPYCVSWARPLPDRHVRRALILANAVFTAEFEQQEVTRCFVEANVDTVLLPGRADSKEGFLERYRDEQWDLIWVISHGEYEDFAPHKSIIPITDETVLTLSDLAIELPPSESRRLMVLNVCGGAAAAPLGGLPDLGIAPVLVSNRQAVISHLWPVGIWPPVAFAGLLAKALVESSDYVRAFERVMAVFTAGKQAVLNGLTKNGVSADVIERIQQDDTDWENILTWGSPVFLQ